MFCYFFFFQAEDGIRDLVRSRGLGDVYKRQSRYYYHIRQASEKTKELQDILRIHDDDMDKKISLLLPPNLTAAVSYTHLTLPTSDLV